MKQEHLNTGYDIHNQNIELYEYNYGQLYAYPQNYLQNFTYFSQNQLFPYYFPPQFEHLYQPFTAPAIVPTALHPSEFFQAPSINEVKTDSLPQPSQQTPIVDQILEQDDPRIDDEEQKKIQRRLSRIKHITEVNKNRVMRKAKKNLTSYYWNSDQNKRYLEFLQSHPGVFDLPVSEKKNIRVNVMMSKKVKTRTPQQCHSHHQKMMKKYGNVQNIIQMMGNEEGQNSEKEEIERDQVKDQVKVENLIIDL